MIVATSATVRNLTSLRGVASAAMLGPLPAKLCAPSRIRRTSHVSLQGKSCVEKGNPGEHLILGTSGRAALCPSAADLSSGSAAELTAACLFGYADTANQRRENDAIAAQPVTHRLTRAILRHARLIWLTRAPSPRQAPGRARSRPQSRPGWPPVQSATRVRGW